MKYYKIFFEGRRAEDIDPPKVALHFKSESLEALYRDISGRFGSDKGLKLEISAVKPILQHEYEMGKKCEPRRANVWQHLAANS